MFILFQKSLEIFQANHWDVKKTMLQLGTLDRQYKAKLKRQREDVEKARKMKAAEKKEEWRKLGLAEKDQEVFTRQPMKEKLKAQKGSVRGKYNCNSYHTLFILNNFLGCKHS